MPKLVTFVVAFYFGALYLATGQTCYTGSLVKMRDVIDDNCTYIITENEGLFVIKLCDGRTLKLKGNDPTHDNRKPTTLEYAVQSDNVCSKILVKDYEAFVVISLMAEGEEPYLVFPNAKKSKEDNCHLEHR